MHINRLFDLVAPLAIYGGADIAFKQKAKKAWAEVLKIDPNVWVALNLPHPNSNWDFLKDWDFIYHNFAKDAYDSLFEQIAFGIRPSWEVGYDKWGAKGLKEMNIFVLSGEESGNFPWYETADLLIKKLLEL